MAMDFWIKSRKLTLRRKDAKKKMLNQPQMGNQMRADGFWLLSVCSVISCSTACGMFEQEETERTEKNVRMDLLGGFAPLREICFLS
jgi:hypothetical protein